LHECVTHATLSELGKFYRKDAGQSGVAATFLLSGQSFRRNRYDNEMEVDDSSVQDNGDELGETGVSETTIMIVGEKEVDGTS
jgi:hypothetical protein